ncbi:MAG: hypothetical protein JWM36_1457 [Hyphomicrobiales bacterium]|nr:hypothetical protein [Hyphomicrobiales bacterium]
MSPFSKRGENFENRFAHDEALRFKATARRNKLLGLWAAQKLGKTDIDALTYARALVAADLAQAGGEDVFRTIRQDFNTAGVPQSDHQIRRNMDEFLARAAAEIHAGL